MRSKFSFLFNYRVRSEFISSDKNLCRSQGKELLTKIRVGECATPLMRRHDGGRQRPETYQP